MKFKSKTGNPVYVATVDGISAVVGPQWRELPERLHNAALAMRGGKDKYGNELGHIVTDGVTDEEEVSQGPEPVESRDPSLSAQLYSVLEEIAANGSPDDFTAAGLPNLKRLSKRCGFSVDHHEMAKAWASVKTRMAA